MKVRLLLFAAFREALGASQMDVEVPERSTVEDLFRSLEATHPRVSALRPYTTFAVNREVVSPDMVLAPHDEVAFLQPASGGAI